ncbi:glycosyl hydrolase 2 galactose-binding domain-containing protein [Arundinibacter roseus]|uniref:Glycoside hydrolase family 2 n=1 Tax=Arundinibacter roseus TaxID=2070510 RepID=A0A4R4K6F9_9BACT|nr:glycoside hydrolase family 2 protein [Arundinibacter roseus]TDB61779.1 glycoside hydrolase family 2 [Arundinibacter roseus]
MSTCTKSCLSNTYYFRLFAILFLLPLSWGCQQPPVVEERTLSESWWIASSAEVRGDAATLSAAETDTTNGWVKTSVPTTVLGALVEANVYKDPFFGKNLETIPKEPFRNSWWFKNSFDLKDFTEEKESLRLLVDGVNYRANIWLNGIQLAKQDTLFGAFRQFELDVTAHAQAGKNTLLIEIFPPQVRDFYMGFVDWAPTPPDQYMGIFREIRLRRAGKVTMDHSFVAPDLNPENLSEATLHITTELTNHQDTPKAVRLTGYLEDVRFEKEITLAAHEHKEIRLSADEFPQLKLKNPRLWWPNGMGSPELYELVLEVHEKQILQDRQNTTFGVRKVETYLTDKDVRGYKINGRPLLIKGAGWVDDLFLRYQPAKDSAQIQYVKNMNLNALRFEGVWGNSQHIYDLCDRNGILLMVGWSCQWEWPDYLGLELNIKPGDENLPINEGVDLYAVKLTPAEETLLSDYFHDQVKWLRNHPSIFTWAGGSDAMPTPTLEKRYRQTLATIDPTRPFLISTGAFESTVSGTSGMKMNGPYEYVPPVYWYEDKKLGGAFGFNSETGPGPQIPPESSIRKMIPEADLWPADNPVWNFHSGRKDFNTMKVYLTALEKRYGAANNLDELTLKAQLMNYEAMRPMFEAFVLNRREATGVIQWMLNSPWPEFYWQLYDYYLMPTGAFYGTQKACLPTQAIYNYQDHSVYVSNDSPGKISGYSLDITYLDAASKIIEKRTEPVTLKADEVVKVRTLSSLKNASTPVTFLDLKIRDQSGKLVANNFYWLAQKADALDWKQYFWFYTPQKTFADFSSLNNLPMASVETSSKITKTSEGLEVTVTLTNPTDRLAFFIELEVQDKNTGQAITPVFWSDNYVSLLPGERKTLTVRTKANPNVLPQIKMRSVNGGSKVF